VCAHEEDPFGKTGDSPRYRVAETGRNAGQKRECAGQAELEFTVGGEFDRIRSAIRVSCAAAAGVEEEGPVSLRAMLIVIVGLAAVIEDLGWRRISNWTSGGAVAGGLIVNYLQKGWSGAWHSLLGALIGFGVFLVFYLLGGMGGGDVKLMAGFGALLGDGRILPAALLAAASGGVMALGYLAVRGIFRRSRIWLGGAVPEAPESEEPVSEEKLSEAKSGESIPYAPAITMGAWLALLSEM
jgi:prepilin peptidase CpaA